MKHRLRITIEVDTDMDRRAFNAKALLVARESWQGGVVYVATCVVDEGPTRELVNLRNRKPDSLAYLEPYKR